MTPETIRELFAAFCGDERYRKFLESFNLLARKRGRLVYWQDQLWTAFVKEQPSIASLTFANLVPIFRLCHLHLVPLADRQIPVIRGLHCVLYSNEHDQTCKGSFPYAREWSLDSPAFKEDVLTVDSCEQCRKSKEEYQRTNPAVKPKDLNRETLDRRNDKSD